MKDADAINRNYRTNDIKRWRTMDFILGYNINISNNPNTECEICKQLAGVYPTSFEWSGWHDGCKCFVTSIMEDCFSESRSKYEIACLKAALHGTEQPIKPISPNMVQYVPESFIQWFLLNSQRMNEENKYPDFIIKNINIIKPSYEYYKNTYQ